MPLGGKAVIGRLSARRYDPGKVAPSGFHSRTGVSLITPLPFAIAQHPHPRESERWLLPLPPLPVGRAGWGISSNRPMKPVAPRPGSGQKQGGRAHTHTHTQTRSHTLTHSQPARAHSHLHKHSQNRTEREKQYWSFSRSGPEAHQPTGKESLRRFLT